MNSKEPAATQRKPINVLFITWDGPQSSYLEGLFLPIMGKLLDYGYHFHVLQFTWSDATTATSAAESAKSHGISYTRVSILRWPISVGSFATALFGAYWVMRLVRRHRIDMLMPRSIMPALGALIAKKMLPKLCLLFDADGLPVDERVDFEGLSPNSATARLLWAIERMAVARADAVTTRSKQAIEILRTRTGNVSAADKFFRVTNCRDETLFVPMRHSARTKLKEQLGIPPRACLLAYASSGMKGKYRGDLLLDFFKLIKSKQSDCHLLILTNQPEEAKIIVNNIARGYVDSIHICQSAPLSVPRYLGACDAGIAFIEPKPSMRAASAVKLGEYLLCGLPVIATAGIGDAEQQLMSKACFFLRNNSSSELNNAAQWFSTVLLREERELTVEARLIGEANYGLSQRIIEYARALDWAAGPLLQI